jgi:hypothetical protein
MGSAEYIANLIGQHISGKRSRGIRIRPFTKKELTALHETLVTERKRAGGATKQTLGA